MPEAELAITAADGRALAATRFEPDASAAGPVLLVSSAMAVKRSFYAPFARAMAADGIPVLTYDYRGIGGSRLASMRRDPATMRDWATKDMAAAIASARALWPARRLVMLGHSAGGWMTGLCPEAASLDGLVLFASQDGHWRNWRGIHRARLWGVWHVGLPTLGATFGHVPGWAGLGQDIPRGVARDWARWGRRRGFVDPEADYAKLRMPVLAVRVADDHYAPKEAVEALLARFPPERLRRRVIEPSELGRPIGHFAYFRRDVGAPLWKEMGDAIRALPAPA